MPPAPSHKAYVKSTVGSRQVQSRGGDLHPSRKMPPVVLTGSMSSFAACPQQVQTGEVTCIRDRDTSSIRTVLQTVSQLSLPWQFLPLPWRFLLGAPIWKQYCVYRMSPTCSPLLGRDVKDAGRAYLCCAFYTSDIPMCMFACCSFQGNEVYPNAQPCLLSS